jgi:hypothetical protein
MHRDEDYLQKIVIFDGPDGTGKTNIAVELAGKLCLPYFKFSGEPDFWRKGQFKTALQFDQPFAQQFLKQTKYSVVWDRAYPAEWCYSRVFKRETDEALIGRLDALYAGMGAWIVVPLRTSYGKNRKDEFVPQEKLIELHEAYNDFCDNFTRCNTIRIFVDTFQDNLDREINCLLKNLRFDISSSMEKISVIAKGNR